MSKLNSIRFSMSHNDYKSRFNSIQSRIHPLWSHYSSPQLTKQTEWPSEGGAETKKATKHKHPADKTKADQSTSKQRSFFGATCSQLAAADPPRPSLALSWWRSWSACLVSSLSSEWSWLKWASRGPVSRAPSELSRSCSLWTPKIRTCLCSLLLATGHHPQRFWTDKRWNGAFKSFFKPTFYF